MQYQTHNQTHVLMLEGALVQIIYFLLPVGSIW